MCGIFFSLSRHHHVVPDDKTATLLRNRGPDDIGWHQTVFDQPGGGHRLHVTFCSTVLSLRGTEVTSQPLIDERSGSPAVADQNHGHVLCWNGEAWSISGEAVTGNDAKCVFELLLEAVSSPDRKAAITNLLSQIRGPYAFVFYDRVDGHIYYGRDCLGRRSLLKKTTADGSFVLSSVCDNSSGEGWVEVEADGIYIIDLKDATNLFSTIHVPHARLGEAVSSTLSFKLPFPSMNREEPSDHDHDRDRQKMFDLGESLRRSLLLRTQHVREAFEAPPASVDENTSHAAKTAILFSGGLDCTVLARLCHDLLPLGEDVDLLNVAFENPRIHSNLESGTSPYELCPDRITGRASHAELQQVCLTRQWRFIEVNVPYAETVAHRATVMSLMHPHNTEMDLSISYALYFASRGVGLTNSSPTSATAYTTPARVLLSGLGADELFGGYQRHATAFSRQGYTGLLNELQLDFERLGKRNLGRDDRVISNSGREVRFPFLDEDFITMALKLPVAEKCDFGRPEYRPNADRPDADVVIEPAKRILRLLAYDLGMKRVAVEKKRAIQFGARTAKMETGRTKGTHVLT